MERSSDDLLAGTSDGATCSSKIPSMNVPQKVGSGSWAIPSGDIYHASSDASLFSISLPVLPHEKLNFGNSEHGGQSVDDSQTGLKNVHQDEEGKDVLEDVDLHAIGSLLPDDEDELLAGIMDDFDIRGMELDFDSRDSLSLGMSKVSLSDGVVGNGTAQYGFPNGVGTDNPSDKDVNQGTLVVFNLDPSVSNDDLRQILGLMGKSRRAAEAALRSLNRSDIAGKRIKLEPSRPGGARRNLMQQLSQELEQDDTRNFRQHVGSPIGNSPPGNWAQFGSPIKHGSMQGLSQSPNLRTISPGNNNHLPGLASILPPQLSNSVKIAPIGKDQSRISHADQIFPNNSSPHGGSFPHSHSFPEPNLSSSPGTVSSLGPSITSSASGIGTLSGPQFLWGSPTPFAEHGTTNAWPAPAAGHSFSPNGQGHGFHYPNRSGPFLGSAHHHVGSAPSGVHFERHFGFFPESPETSYMSPPVNYGGMGFNRNEGNFMMNIGTRATVNSGVSLSGNMPENGSAFRVMPSSRMGPLYMGSGPYLGPGASSIEGLAERGRSRRVESNGSQIDSKKQYQLDLDKIINGEDIRTTLMIKISLTSKEVDAIVYTSKMLLAAIDENHRGTYDFLYLPIDFKNKCNVGYAFINMVSPSHIIPFYQAFNGKKWEKFNSEKVASLAYARIQGKAALVTHFQNSSLMNEDKRCRPILFHSEGLDVGDQIIQEPFPSNNLNICVRQPDGSYLGDSSDSPKEGSLGEKPEKS
ncbi:hypothetical protein Scep_011932 [Stephania cephalantha]|uniref:Mei2-like C-terminal RNA recognition motif domain-containing protein n=1 Tax=Stephania cephalantha TaxID=152367 RepID=A0AAP0JE82_9MAGN